MIGSERRDSVLVRDFHADATRAVKDDLARLDDASFGAASEVRPKFVSPFRSGDALDRPRCADPAFFDYANNYLIDTDHAIIVNVEATRAVRQAKVGAARTMIDRPADRFGLRRAGDSAYGAAPMLAWLVKDKAISPHVPVFDRFKRDDGTLCPQGKSLRTTGRVHDSRRLLYGSQRPIAICARSN